MILVDTSIWIDHLRTTNGALVALLDTRRILGHAWVTGELSLGNLRQRDEVLILLGSLPQAVVADPSEIAVLIDSERLHGIGIGYVDAQLLASTRLTADTSLWTADKRLDAAADRLGVSATGLRRPPKARNRKANSSVGQRGL